MKMGVGHSMTSKIDLENTLEPYPFCGGEAEKILARAIKAVEESEEE